MKRILNTCLAALLIASLMAPTVLANPTSSELKDKKEEAQQEVTELQKELADILKKINQLESDLIAKGEEIQVAEENLAEAEEQEQEQYEDMKLRIKFMYETGDSDALEAIFASENFSEMLNRAEYVQNVHAYDRQMLDEYVAIKEEIKELKTDLEAEMAELEGMHEEFESEKSSLDTLIEEKKEEVEDIENEIQKALEREEEERRRREEANKNNNNGGGSTNHYNGTGDASVGSAIVSAAASYLGVPYVWGGTSRSGVDCSGLVYLAHKAVGISVARYSGTLGSQGKAISASEAKPGDVVCYSGHVGIYVGGGQMIHAPRPGKVVCYQNVNYKAHWFRRYW